MLYQNINTDIYVRLSTIFNGLILSGSSSSNLERILGLSLSSNSNNSSYVNG